MSLECFRFALKMSLPCAILAALLKFSDKNLGFNFLSYIMPESHMYNSFTFLVGFVVVFHTSQAYNRYMGGITLAVQIMGDFVDVMSLICSFAKASDATYQDVGVFLKKCARLLSLLFVNCLAELEEIQATPTSQPKKTSTIKRAYGFNLISAEGLDPKILEEFATSPCKVETICQMFQTAIADGMHQGILKVPPPLLTRVYQELGNGVIKYHEAMKFNLAPYPFPYVAVADMLMFVHWMFTPFMVGIWTKGAMSAFLFTFIQTFAFWSLNSIAGQLDNPFGEDITDLDTQGLVENFHDMIRTLVKGHPFSDSSEQQDLEANDEFFNPNGSGMTIAMILQRNWGSTAMIVHSHQHLISNHLGRRWLVKHNQPDEGLSVVQGIPPVILQSIPQGIPQSIRQDIPQSIPPRKTSENQSAEGSSAQTTLQSSKPSDHPHLAMSSPTCWQSQHDAMHMGRPQEGVEQGDVQIFDTSASSQHGVSQPPHPPPCNATTSGTSLVVAQSLQQEPFDLQGTTGESNSTGCRLNQPAISL